VGRWQGERGKGKGQRGKQSSLLVLSYKAWIGRDLRSNFAPFPFSLPEGFCPIPYWALTESRNDKTVKATKVPSKAAPTA
jgi:hypothetical protein